MHADPEVHSNVVNPPENFVPGLDSECKQAVEEDRELRDKDSLTICGAGSDGSVDIKSLELKADVSILEIFHHSHGQDPREKYYPKWCKNIHFEIDKLR